MEGDRLLSPQPKGEEVVKLLNCNKTFILDAKKHSLTMRVVKHWIRLPREVVECLALEAFKRSLDKSLGEIHD